MEARIAEKSNLHNSHSHYQDHIKYGRIDQDYFEEYAMQTKPYHEELSFFA